MERCPDMYDAFCKHEAEQERELAERQVCDCCGETITEDHCYEIFGGYICQDCMTKYHMVETPVKD